MTEKLRKKKRSKYDKYVLKTSKIWQNTHLYPKYDKYALTNWAHFTQNVTIHKDLHSMRDLLQRRKACQIIKILALIIINYKKKMMKIQIFSIFAFCVLFHIKPKLLCNSA